MTPPPLDGALRARFAFVTVGQGELQEPLGGDEGHG
jgi:hypothetical protein